jgi:hypothetical protein
MKVKAITNFTWQGREGSYLVRAGEIISVDKVAYKQLVEEEGYCIKLTELESEVRK